ncbi:energy transducer TonB [Aequorivita todarodis]|uniref:energy transducer TonB n=1 Tax=Aequorivita todarodis TaxID=2036821 RepID=UPI00234FB928|nr:energy transducer TonB [Aequorivita todarodis]MDC8001817.1 energy transducer TonB [Aequorivita todarodis]
MIFKKFLFLYFLSCVSISFAQKVTEVSESEMGKTDVPYAVIENVPVYPGCDGNGNQELKQCMSTKISEFVSLHFNMKKIEALDLPPRIYRTAVQFKINKEGKVVDVRARAEHPEIENEAVRVVSNLPQMQPGKQRGEAVGVLYSLPIIFKVEPPKKVDKKGKKRKRKN